MSDIEDVPPLEVDFRAHVDMVLDMTTRLIDVCSRIFGISDGETERVLLDTCGEGTDFVAIHLRPAQLLRYLTEGFFPAADPQTPTHVPPHWSGYIVRSGKLEFATRTTHTDALVSVAAMYPKVRQYTQDYLHVGPMSLNMALKDFYGSRSVRHPDAILDLRRMYTLLSCVAHSRLRAGDLFPEDGEMVPGEMSSRQGALGSRVRLVAQVFGCERKEINKDLRLMRGNIADEDFEGLFDRLRALDSRYDAVRHILASR